MRLSLSPSVVLGALPLLCRPGGGAAAGEAEAKYDAEAVAAARARMAAYSAEAAPYLRGMEERLAAEDAARRLQVSNDDIALANGLARTLIGFIVRANSTGSPTCPRDYTDTSYFLTTSVMSQIGYQPFYESINALQGGDMDGINNGLCAVEYLTHESVVRELGQFAARQYSADPAARVYRANDLGRIRLAPDNWAAQPIITGYSADDHEAARPLLDFLFGDGRALSETSFAGAGPQWSRDALLASARAWLAGRESVLVNNDVNAWVAAEMAGAAFGPGWATPDVLANLLTVQALDTFTSIFELRDREILMSFLPPAAFFNGVKASLSVAFVARLRERQAAGEIPVDVVDLADDETARVAAYAIIDSFTAAGGSSVPNSIKHALASYYAGLAGDIDVTNPMDVGLLYLEAIRHNPLVFGVPYVAEATGFRQIPIVGYAGYDKGVYGDDADSFRIRGDHAWYQARSQAFAEAAQPLDGRPGTAHVCPGRSLSYALATAFITALGPDDWVVEGGADTLFRGVGLGFWLDFTLVPATAEPTPAPTGKKGKGGKGAKSAAKSKKMGTFD